MNQMSQLQYACTHSFGLQYNGLDAHGWFQNFNWNLTECLLVYNKIIPVVMKWDIYLDFNHPTLCDKLENKSGSETKILLVLCKMRPSYIFWSGVNNVADLWCTRMMVIRIQLQLTRRCHCVLYVQSLYSLWRHRPNRKGIPIINLRRDIYTRKTVSI